MGRGWASPDPRLGASSELVRGDTGHVGNVAVIGQRLPGEGFAPRDAPPALDEVEPGGSHRNTGVPDARMCCSPVPDRATGVAGEMVGNQREVAPGIGAVQRLEQVEVACRVARGSGLGQRLTVMHRERPIAPDLLWSPVVVERSRDPVAVW
jgi:hypothetical protein